MESAIPRKKVELHIHLDGAVRPSTAWQLTQKKGISIPGVSSLLDFERACVVSKPSNLWGFIQHFNVFMPAFCGDMDALERIAYEYCEDAHYAGVVYSEVRYSPTLILGEKALKEVGPQGFDEVIVRISRGLKKGENDFGIKVRTILCAIYTEEFNDLQEILQQCRAHYQDGVVGMDLVIRPQKDCIVDEAPLAEPVISVFQEASRTGVHRTIHAGEASGSQAIERAKYQLGSERVGHGYHVVQDPQLYQRCLQDQVHFECCPYSSLMTGAVNVEGKDHPIARFAKDGANFSINSDDPTVTGHYVQSDYELLASWGVTASQMAQANINAAKSSFLSDQEKNELLKQLREDNDNSRCSIN